MYIYICYESPSQLRPSSFLTTSEMSSGKRPVQYGVSSQTAHPRTRTQTRLMILAPAGQTQTPHTTS